MDGHGISGFGYSSPGPARSPVSPFAGNIDSPAGQVALAQPCLRDGAHALQFRRVRARPVLALHFRTSHGARARHLRLSQAAVTSDGHPAVGAQRAAHLQRLGSAARRLSALGEAAERWHDVASPCGRGCGAQAAGEARCVARFCGSRRTAVCARSEKNDDRDAVVSLYGVTVVTQALPGVHSDAS